MKLNRNKSSHVLKIESLYYKYPRTTNWILSDINLEVPRNSLIILVGRSGSGKSTLLNRCILKEQVFTVGSTVQACTKGILLVKKVLDGPILENGKPLPVIVIDTEGLGSVDATNTHDTRIFSMALLLSSLFIYNSVGAMDENALYTLS